MTNISLLKGYSIKIATSLVVLFVPVHLSCAQSNVRTMSFEDVIEKLYLQSSDIKQSDISYHQSVLDISNFELSKLPSLSFNLNPAGFSQSIVSLQDPNTGNFNYTNSFVNNSNAGMTISQPINITGGKLQVNTSLNMMNEFSLQRNTFSSTPIRVSYYQPLVGGRKKYIFERDLIKYTQRNLSNTLKAAHYTVQQKCTELYMAVLIADLALKNAQINRNIADTVFALSKIKNEFGEITEQDFIQAEIQLEQSIVDMSNFKMARQKAMRKLLTYLNMNNESYEVQIPLQHLSRPINIEQAMSDVAERNPFFIEFQKQNLEAKRNLYNTKVQNGFNADVSLSYGLNQYGNQFYKAYQNPSLQQNITVGLKIPIVDWGITRNGYQVAKLRYDSQMIDIENKHKDILENIKAMVEEYNHGIELVDVMARYATLSRKQYQITVQNFGSGANTFFELATTRQQLIQTEKAYLEQLSRVWVTYYSIRAITISEY